jgi:hypothetical protein
MKKDFNLRFVESRMKIINKVTKKDEIMSKINDYRKRLIVDNLSTEFSNNHISPDKKRYNSLNNSLERKPRNNSANSNGSNNSSFNSNNAVKKKCKLPPIARYNILQVKKYIPIPLMPVNYYPDIRKNSLN